MSFNAPIRVPINNKNNGLSDQASHFKAYIRAREEVGNPVKFYSKFGAPEGFHHPDKYAPNGIGIGKPIAITHHQLAKSIRDQQPKFVHDKRFNLPADPVLYHHPDKKVDYRSLPRFTPQGGSGGDSWKISSLGLHYIGKSASSVGARQYLPNNPPPVTLPRERLQPMSRTHAAHELPPAGLRLSKFTELS